MSPIKRLREYNSTKMLTASLGVFNEENSEQPLQELIEGGIRSGKGILSKLERVHTKLNDIYESEELDEASRQDASREMVAIAHDVGEVQKHLAILEEKGVRYVFLTRTALTIIASVGMSISRVYGDEFLELKL